MGKIPWRFLWIRFLATALVCFPVITLMYVYGTPAAGPWTIFAFTALFGVIGALGAWSFSAFAAQMEAMSIPTRQLRDKYLNAVRVEYPLWLNSRLNPTTPEQKFEATILEMREELEANAGDPALALQIISHLLDVWPGGLLGHNADYVLREGRRLGLLDHTYRPVLNTSPINEELRTQQEIRRLGGQRAVDAYKETSDS